MPDEKDRAALLRTLSLDERPTAPTTFLGSMYSWFDSWAYWRFDIHEACRTANYAALKRFVDAHPDRTQLKAMVNRPDEIELPPFYYLTIADTKKGSLMPQLLACAQLLLELGANSYFDKYERPNNNTLLIDTILSRRTEMAALLVKYGAKIDGVEAPTGGPLASIPFWAAKIEEIKRLSKTDLDFISAVEEESSDEDYAAYRASAAKKLD